MESVRSVEELSENKSELAKRDEGEVVIASCLCFYDDLKLWC